MADGWVKSEERRTEVRGEMDFMNECCRSKIVEQKNDQDKHH